MIDHPRVLSLLCLVATSVMSLLGVWLRIALRIGDEEDKGTLGVVLSAALTLLGLIIGFTFSMASTRYEQRRLYEEQEANAIGTEWVRVDLLPADQARIAHNLLRQYLDNRLQFYALDYGPSLDANIKHLNDLQAQLCAPSSRRQPPIPTPLSPWSSPA